MNRFVVGTAGHVDHGKTRLVQALTGVDCDRWEEEKERGITIDLGFASMIEDDWQIGFVDVPGHERFVHNALAGLGGIQMMVLVVAADEGVMPQTREHLAICSLLRIPAGLAVLSKTDLVAPDLLEVAQLELEDALAETPFAGAPVLPVSAETGAGLDELRAALVRLARTAAPRGEASQLPARLPIDRAFKLRGLGVLVTGTLSRGAVAVGDELDVLPAGGAARVRSIEVHGEARKRAEAGERTSLQLVGVAPGDLVRGAELTAPGAYRGASSLLVRCRLLANAPAALTESSEVRLHIGAAQRIGRMRPLEPERLEPGAGAVAEIRVDEPLVAIRGDRFVIRRPSPPTTLGGGEVLDPAWRRRPSRDLRAAIHGLAGDRQSAAVQWTADGREAGMETSELALRLGIDQLEAERILAAAADDGLLLNAGDGRHVTASVVRRALRRARRLVEAHFAADRLSRGMPKAELARRLLGARAAHLAPAYLAWSTRADRGLAIAVQGELVTLPDRGSNLTETESELAQSIVHGFEAQGLTPGSPEELCRRLQAKPQVFEGVLRYLIDRGRLTRLSTGLLLASSTVEKLQNDLLATDWEMFTVADFKDRFDLTRKWAIPLLEHLDRQRLTRREGDRRRVLRPRG